ncbi:MAG: lysine--tRNA ligase [Candidatus Omnitrophica bacterium CG07_land_8_20_14_0_80_50_8]|nr:MAG: lysine--tRNA ligase [Candidatus Omnitrophica bacterium CG07_land_8_20_14_0_80_50_8]
MNEINGLTKERLKKLESIRAMGFDPFGGKFLKECLIADLVKGFEEHKRVRTAGRLFAMRLMGKSTFCDLKDESGLVQLYVRPDHLSDQQFQLFQNMDMGDLVGVEGEFFKTRTEAISIRVDGLFLLSKSLRPMPEKWHGLKDVEIRYRRRYLDLISNDETREIFKKRSLIIRSLRRVLDEQGYLEVETPMMHSIPGGAAGKPFKTHHEALDMDLYLRVAPELYLKKLLVGGFEKVYEINKSFRNEGISTRHNPEFTMLEVYTAYQDVHDVMDLTEAIVKKTARDVLGTLVIDFEGTHLDLGQWQRVSFADIMNQKFDIQPEDPVDAWIEKLKRNGVRIEGKNLSRSQLVNVVGEMLEPGSEFSKKENRPVFVTDYFTELCPLAKKSKKNPYLSDRFELYIGGMEIANGYSELNDPIEQRQRLLTELKEKGKDSTYETLDEDFLTALEYGMPPAGGLGIGIDRLVMVLTHQPSIREVILFPQMKPEGQ